MMCPVCGSAEVTDITDHNFFDEPLYRVCGFCDWAWPIAQEFTTLNKVAYELACNYNDGIRVPATIIVAAP